MTTETNKGKCQAVQTFVHQPGIDATYEYDALSRLLEVVQKKRSQKPNPKPKVVEQYAYDATGNRLEGPRRRDDYAYNAANELLTVRGKTFTYDLNGNVVTKADEDPVTPLGAGKTWTFTYDPENRLVGAVKTEGTETKEVEYTYDPFGRRIEKKITDNDGDVKTERFFYDNEDILLITDGDDRIFQTFVHGPGIDEPLSITEYDQSKAKRRQETFFYHADGLGSIVALTDTKGKVVQEFVFDSFGNLRGGAHKIKQPYSFTGREYDRETGLYYYRARYYDPEVGRFISKDPFGGFLSLPQTLNRYTYVINNPQAFVDPFGLEPVPLQAKVLTYADLDLFFSATRRIEMKIRQRVDEFLTPRRRRGFSQIGENFITIITLVVTKTVHPPPFFLFEPQLPLIIPRGVPL